jgi:hypothetical protein
MKQDVAGIDLIHHMAGLVGDFDAAVVERAAMQQLFAQYLADAVDRFLPRRLGVGQFLAFFVPVEGLAFADMKEVFGHGVGFAARLTITYSQS